MRLSVLMRSRAWLLLAVAGVLLAACGFVACSDDTVDSLEEVRALHAQRRYEATLEPLRAMLDENPAQPEVNFLLGRALMQTGDSSLAIWPLGKAIESPEYAVEAGVMLARAMFLGRTTDDAIRAADQVLAIDPDNVEALAIRGQSLVQANKLKDALQQLDHLQELDPDNLSALVPRIIALLKLDRIEEAGEALDAAKQIVTNAEGPVGEGLRGRLCVATALFSFERGDPELADTQYADCLEAYPTNPLVVQSVVEHHDKLGQIERADEILETAFAESRDPVFRRSMAQRANRSGDLERQEELLRAEVDEQPSAQAWFGLGDFYAQLDRNDDACDAFEQAAALDPTPPILFAYADTLIVADRLSDADEVSRRLEQPELRDLIQGRILLAQGDPAGALVRFESGIRLWPNNPGARFLAGQAAESLGDFDRAISEYREAERADPKQTEAGLYLGRILAEKGTHRSALTAIQRYVTAHPRDPEGVLLAIRVAHLFGNRRVTGEGLERLAQMQGQAPVAIAEQSRLIAEIKGREEGLKSLETSQLDLTDPTNAVVLEELISQLGVAGRFDSARERVASAVAAHPDEADFHAIAGRVELEAGDSTEAAKAAFDRALELDPEHLEALIGLAKLAHAAGDVKGAIAHYDRATAAHEDDARAGKAAAALATGDAAERRLLAVLEHHPRDVEAASALAELLASEGKDLERALHYARRADYFRSAPEAAEVLGRVLVLRGEPAAAVEPLKRSVDQRPESSAAHLYLGQALAGTGDIDGAREALETVIEAAGPEAAQARAELKRLDESG